MPSLINRGRLAQFIAGIAGVNPGGRMQINMPTNIRLHEIHLQLRGIAYQPGTTVVPATADAGATFTPVITAGVITAITIVGAVSIKADGTYPLTITDPSGNGSGATGTYTVVGGVVTAATVTGGGVVSDVAPYAFFTAFQEFVNGINMRDIGVQDRVNIANANQELQGIVAGFGELPLYYSEPWRRIVENDEVNAWDLQGQNTFQIFGDITKNITNPSVQGCYSFDNGRNLRTITSPNDKLVISGAAKVGDTVPFLEPVSQHRFVQLYQAGRNPIVTIPSNYKISRLWVYADTADITQFEIWQDGNMVLQVTDVQAKQLYEAYGFKLDVFKRAGLTPNQSAIAFIADADQRLYRALSAKTLQVVVYLSAPANVTVVEESLPGAFQA